MTHPSIPSSVAPQPTTGTAAATSSADRLRGVSLARQPRCETSEREVKSGLHNFAYFREIYILKRLERRYGQR